jgi:tol-pal system protein YbgF
MRVLSRALLSAPLVLLLLTAPGCVSRENVLLRTEVQDLQNRIYELQKRYAEAEVTIQELKEQAPPAPSPSGSGAGPAPVTPAEVARSFSEPEVPGSTIDLGPGGPSRNVASEGGTPGEPPESTSKEGAPAAPAAPAPGTGSESIDKLYVEGYSRFNSGDYDAAEKAFQEFLARSPDSDLADDAQYWIGECFFSRKDYRRSVLEFRKVIDQYPFGNRVPHAFLKIGLSYLALGDRDRAAENLETVVQAFPKSDVATVARATLDQIGKH